MEFWLKLLKSVLSPLGRTLLHDAPTPPHFPPERPKDSLWGACCLSTFMIISSVFPWPTASGLMMAKVQVFSDEAAINQGWCCQTRGSSILEALRRPLAGTTQLPGVPHLASGCAPADLDYSGSTRLAADLNLNLAAGDRYVRDTDLGWRE